MKTKFIIHPGTIEISEENIRINDGRSWRTKLLILAVSMLIILTGSFYLVEYIISKNPQEVPLFFTGLILDFAGAAIIVGQIRSSSRETLDVNNISKVIVREKRFSYLIADFIVTKGPRRRVILDINDTLQFASLFLDDFRQALNNKNIMVEIHKSVNRGT